MVGNRKKDYINNIPKEDMEKGLKSLTKGDLIFDPWYGFGILLDIDISYHRCQIKFYDKHEQTFVLDDSQAYFLKKNVTILLKVAEMVPKGEDAKKYWGDMYCIF